MSGIEAVKRIKERQPELEVLMLTVYQDDQLVIRFALRRGMWLFSKKYTSE